MPARWASVAMDTPNRLAASALLILILLLAAALRFCCLDAQSLWNDEGTSVAVAQRDPVTIARNAAADIHPPLYYWSLSGWVRMHGTSETAVRSLSALLGVVLVALTYALGWQVAGRWLGFFAAFLGAISPFQVYYSQEARMYILVAVLAAGAVLALVRYVRGGSRPVLVVLILLEAAGIYTHYSFVLIIVVLNLGYLFQPRSGASRRQHWAWAISQGTVALLYLPWLPTALRQVATWPSPAQATGLAPALASTWRWLVYGPTIETSQVIIALLVGGVITAYGAVSLGIGWLGRSRPEGRWLAGLLLLWLGLPVVLMLALGLYRDAYLKFMLVTAPAVCLLLACGLLSPLRSAQGDREDASRSSRLAIYSLRIAQVLAGLIIVLGSAVSLGNYYGDLAYARDNYRGLAAYIEAVGQPGDAILLNAPGQQEVFGYYYDGDLPVFPLPEARPLDPDATEAALALLARPSHRVLAVLWATDESDPERFVEGWLDANAFKALDSWYGNVRLAVYAVPEQNPPGPDPGNGHLETPLVDGETGDKIILLGYSGLDGPRAAGDIAPITLFWEIDQTPSRRYKVFLHVLDNAGNIVGQRDSEPGGGAHLTTLWTPGETVTDNYGVPIHPATPPGEYRVEMGMYDAETGRRLVTLDGEGQIWLEPLTVTRPAAPAPLEALGMQHDSDASFGALTLLGYDTHKLGFAHQPEEPLRPGDLLHVNLYWRAHGEPSGDWQVMIGWQQLPATIVAEPVVGYPTSQWQKGDVWRGQFNLAVPVDAPAGQSRFWVQPLASDGSAPEGFLSEPLIVEP